MKIEEYDLEIMIFEGQPIILAGSPAGRVFLEDVGTLWYETPEEFMSFIPSHLRVKTSSGCEEIKPRLSLH